MQNMEQKWFLGGAGPGGAECRGLMNAAERTSGRREAEWGYINHLCDNEHRIVRSGGRQRRAR